MGQRKWLEGQVSSPGEDSGSITSLAVRAGPNILVWLAV